MARSAEEAPEVGKIVALIEQGIEQTRSLAKGLLLAEIERDGLVTALEGLAATIRSQHRIECEFSCNTVVSLSESGTATHVYRIAEEATRNAVRHGKARRIALALEREADELVLAVRDDGMGIPAPERRGQGLGLRIMAHRAAIIGASFAVKAQPQGGTSVECRLPHLAPDYD